MRALPLLLALLLVPGPSAASFEARLLAAALARGAMAQESPRRVPPAFSSAPPPLLPGDLLAPAFRRLASPSR